VKILGDEIPASARRVILTMDCYQKTLAEMNEYLAKWHPKVKVNLTKEHISEMWEVAEEQRRGKMERGHRK